MLFADPDAIEALARGLDDKAEEVREQNRAFGRRVEHVRWQSVGAGHYRAQCGELSRELEGNAGELNDAADLLRQHAREVRERIAWMHTTFDKIRSEAEEAWNEAEDTAEDVFDWGQEQADDAWSTVKSWL